jgi:hypothetical protein
MQQQLWWAHPGQQQHLYCCCRPCCCCPCCCCCCLRYLQLGCCACRHQCLRYPFDRYCCCWLTWPACCHLQSAAACHPLASCTPACALPSSTPCYTRHCTAAQPCSRCTLCSCQPPAPAPAACCSWRSEGWRSTALRCRPTLTVFTPLSPAAAAAAQQTLVANS